MRKTIFSLLLLVCCCALLNVVTGGILLIVDFVLDADTSLSQLGDAAVNFSPGKIGLGLVHLMTFVGGTLLWYALQRKPWTAFSQYFKLDKDPTPRLTLTSVGIVICLLPLMGLIVHGLTALDLPDFIDNWDQDQTELLQGILQMDGIADLLLLLIVVALLPAIGEELVFRGVIQQSLTSKIGVGLGIVVTSIVFSAVHMQIMGFLPKLLIGLALGFVFHRTQHLYFPMLMHFVNNALPVLGLYMAGGQLPESQTINDAEWAQLLPSAAISIALLIFAVRYLIRITAIDESQP